MNTHKFSSDKDEFYFIGLTAKYNFKSETSISFHIGRLADRHLDEAPSFVMSVFEVLGWIDVHHPCSSTIKGQIRVCIPAEYHPLEQMNTIVDTIREALSIPPEDHCESLFFSSDDQTVILANVYFGTG